MATTNSVSSYSYLSSAGSRFSGLASGMDIDSIVEKLMKAESAKMEKLQQQKQKYEWQRDAYRSVNTKLEAFRADAFDNFGKVSNFVVNKVSNSNESKASAVATSTASGTMTISEATIATAAFSVSTTEANRTNTTKLADLAGFTAASGTVTLEVAQQDGTLKEVKIEYTSDDTLESFANKINAKKGGVTAVVGQDGKFSLTAAATGNFDGGTIRIKTDENSVSSDTNGVFAAIGFGNGTVLADNGTDAQYTVNGVTQTSKSNTFSISGYNITLKGNISAGDTPTTISSTLDTDTVVDKVKSFIEVYNGLITDLKGQTSQKKNYNYAPLTDAQKAEMTEDQIKNWEVQSKQGILRNDSAITNALSKMRDAISGTTIEIDGKKLNIFSLGLDTNRDGTLVIKDEAKLRAQIEDNPNNVAELFTKSSTTATSQDGGIVANIRSAAKSAIDSISAKAGKESAAEETYSLGKEISSISDRIKEWQTRLKTIEDRYYNQFTAMETAIQKANSQSSLFA